MASTSGGNNSTVQAILELSREHPEGLTEDILQRELPYIPIEERAEAINTLLQRRALQLFTSGDTLMYKPISTQQAVQFRGLTPEDMLLYQTIKQSGTKGIWTKEMKFQTQLQQPQITKIIKTLEGRRLIKAVKAVNSKSKKVYMLYELEPSAEVTGGSWYTDSEFDSNLILAIRELCLSHIVSGGGDTLDGIVAAVRRAGAAGRDSLSMEDYKQVMSTLMFDNEVEVFVSTGTGRDSRFPPGVEVYRACRSRALEMTALTSIPCGVCPVIAECADGGIVSPQTCVYYQKWLEF